MIKPFNTKVAGRDPIFAKEWNRLTGYIESIMRALMREGYVDSSGIYLRKRPDLLSQMTKVFKIFEVADSDPTGDGVYDCKEQEIDGSEWTGVGGADKLVERSSTQINVLNLLDAHVIAGAPADSLIAGDKLLSMKVTDDDGDSRWVGIPLPVGGFVRRAQTQAAAGAATTISCKLLDQDGTETGAAFTVNCDIQGGGNLNSCIPRLADDSKLTVYNHGGNWYCTTVFQTSEDCVCS